MKVKEAIEILKSLDPELDLYYYDIEGKHFIEGIAEIGEDLKKEVEIY